MQISLNGNGCFDYGLMNACHIKPPLKRRTAAFSGKTGGNGGAGFSSSFFASGPPKRPVSESTETTMDTGDACNWPYAAGGSIALFHVHIRTPCIGPRQRSLLAG